MVEKQILNNASATLAMEGLYVTDSERKRGLECLEGKLSFEDVICEIIEKYKRGV